MASIYTGLAFMHGHIVDKELVLRLGRDQTRQQPAKQVPGTASVRAVDRDLRKPAPARATCATC